MATEERLTFDQLVALYRDNPEEFDAYRQRTIRAEINKVPDGPRRRRLNALQWQLDVHKRRYKNPTAWNNHLHAVMLAKLKELGDSLKKLMGEIRK